MDLKEIRIHGRGGQGVVTGAELVAMAGFLAGLETQAFPLFGVERSGAPISAFARFSGQKIITKDQVYHPDFLIIQDPTLLDQEKVFSGISGKTMVVVNSEKTPRELSVLIKKETGVRISEKMIHAAPATEIALRVIGKNIINTVILGAFAQASGLVSLANLESAIKEKFQGKGAEVINKNLAAIKEAYDFKK